MCGESTKKRSAKQPIGEAVSFKKVKIFEIG
jgi:hypothetical protein